ncbi:MAG: hypothetical protein ACI9OJ_005528 [Myxococcota bacterium]|jgi:hypothetical protein
MNSLAALLQKSVLAGMGDKNVDLSLITGGVAALLSGQKLAALAMFGRGYAGLERAWRDAHPDFEGDFRARWNEAVRFYAETHQEPTNKKLHVIGIPMIVGGTAGLILFPAFRPLWGVSAAAFTAGWVLNFVGHGVYEKAAPAFADDPLSFLAGPFWDWQQMQAAKTSGSAVDVTDGAHVPLSNDIH